MFLSLIFLGSGISYTGVFTGAPVTGSTDGGPFFVVWFVSFRHYGIELGALGHRLWTFLLAYGLGVWLFSV